jgi:ribosome-associated heat shock protein Hsp15
MVPPRMPSLRWPVCAPMAESLRLDKFLWFARIVKTRSLAQQLAEEGRIRIGGRVVTQAHAQVRIGDVLSFALRGRVRVIRIEGLPQRRGPAAEARSLYSDLSERPLTSEAQAD